jgi:hypothetical protein
MALQTLRSEGWHFHLRRLTGASPHHGQRSWPELARIARALTEDAMSRGIIPLQLAGLLGPASCGSIGDRDGRRQDRSAW